MASPDYAEAWEAQVEELVVLQSILGEHFDLVAVPGLDDPGEAGADELTALQPPKAQQPIECLARVHLTLPNETMELLASSSSPDRPESSAETAGPDAAGPSVQHLPPLLLNLLLPADYPSQQPPHYSLRAGWLSPPQIAALRARLDELWDEQGAGMPIIFTWVSWLQESALEQLGATHRLDLQWAASSAGDEKYDDSEGAQNGVGDGPGDGPGDAEALMMQLLRYSAGRELELFRAGQWPCGICLEEVPGTQCLRNDECPHFFCAGCLGEYCRMHTREGTVEQLLCPDPKCRRPLSHTVVQAVLSPEEAARWEEMTLQRSLARMADVVFCPRCSSACLEDAENCAQCPKCWYVFCSLCDDGWHPGQQCVSLDTKLRLLRARMAGSREDAAELRRREQEYLNLASIKKTAKCCPSCNMAIQKSEGCNKMVCGNCGAYFCYRCNNQISGYDHYSDGGCVLFEEAEILRWEQQFGEQRHMHERFVNQARQEFWQQQAVAGGAGPRERVGHCPQCRQANWKFSNNNHMSCWACGTHFCYLCRAALAGRKGGRHFTPSGCRQHTDD